MRDNEVVDLLNNAWSERSIEDPSIGLLAIVPSKQITLDPTNATDDPGQQVTIAPAKGGRSRP